MAQLQQTGSEEEATNQWRSEAHPPAVPVTAVATPASNSVATSVPTPVSQTPAQTSVHNDPLRGEVPAAARHVRPDELLAALATAQGTYTSTPPSQLPPSIC